MPPTASVQMGVLHLHHSDRVNFGNFKEFVFVREE